MFKTQKEVHEFLSNQQILHPIINQHPITIEDVNDGDIWCRITIPLDGLKGNIAHAIVKLLANTFDWCPGATIYANTKVLQLHITEHMCDPG